MAQKTTNNRVNIRPATPADLPGILAIYNEAVLNTTASYDETPQTLDDRTAWFEEHLQNGHPVLVATDTDGYVVGWGALSGFRGRWGYRFTAEDSVYVAADRRGQGIGKQLLQALIDVARQKGLHALIAGINSEGTASLRLHAALGFEKVGHLREVGYKFGRRLDVIFMELLF